MSRVMFITMGTSLFESASWDPNRGPAADLCPEYREEWVAGAALNIPEKRRTSPSSRRIRSDLRARLEKGEPTEWAAAMPQEFLDGEPPKSEFLRYSAELATLLYLSERRKLGTSTADFLRGYDSIQLIYDDGKTPQSALPALAARYLTAALDRLAGRDRVESCKISGLSSLNPGELLGEGSGLPLLGKKLAEQAAKGHEIDCVISGGYKLYGIYLGQLAQKEESRLRLLYLHEGGDEVMPIQIEAASVASRATDSERRAARGWHGDFS